MAGSTPDPQIGGILPQHRVDALELVFSHLPADERHRQIGEALGEMSLPADGPLEGLIGARRNGRLVGAMFSQIAPGRTAIVWLPRLVAGEPEATAAGLYAATWEFLARRRIVLAQALLSMVGRAERATLRLGGFRRLANLLYLVSRESEFPTTPPITQLDLEPYSAARGDQWAASFRRDLPADARLSGLGRRADCRRRVGGLPFQRRLRS